jgi:hypothetical protein
LDYLWASPKNRKVREICELKNLFLVEDKTILAEHLFLVIPAQYPEPITKAKANIKLVYYCFGYIGFSNVRRTRKIIISLEFDDTREKTKSTCLCNPYEKGRPMREISRKL